MEKIKALLSPGKSQDDERLYGTGNSGRLDGEGAHFPAATGSSTESAATETATGSSLTNTTATDTSGRSPLSSDTTSATGNTRSSTNAPGYDHLSSGTASGLPNTTHQSDGYGSTGGAGMPGTFDSTSSAFKTGDNGTSSQNALTASSGLGDQQMHHQNTMGASREFPLNDSGNSSSNAILSAGTAEAPSSQYARQDTTATGLGAAAIGDRTHHHSSNRSSGQNSDYTGNAAVGSTGLSQASTLGTAASGPHQTMAANRLDPNLDATGRGGLENAHHHAGDNRRTTVGGGAEEADGAHVKNTGSAQAVPASDFKYNTVGSGSQATTGPGGIVNAAYEHNEGSRHHAGRDAALGAGVGGAAYAAAEHHKHDKDLTQAERDAKREHKHDLKEEKKLHHDQKHAHGTTSGDHTARNVAIGAGAGVGASGVAAHEHAKHSDIAATSDLPGPAPNTAGPHSKDWMNKLDPRVDSAGVATGSTGSRETTAPQSSYTGDDLGVKHRNVYVDPVARDTPGFVDTPSHPIGSSAGPGAYGTRGLTNQAGTAGTTAGVLSGGSTSGNAQQGHHTVRDTAIGAGAGAGALGIAEHERNHYGGNAPPSTTGTTTNSSDTATHHYGRDAAGAGVVGAGAYELDQHHKHDKDLTRAEKEAKREHKHEVKEEKKLEKEHHKEEKKSPGGLLSFLHRDKNKKYTKEEEDEFDRQEREHNSHKGRDAAAVGGAGALGTAAYEAEKHHGHQSSLTDRTVGSSGQHTGSHVQKWEGGDGPSTEYAPPGTTLGDHLHGVARNRGDPTATDGFPDHSHNKLHKDPPSSHPASHGGVTADGRHIEPGTGKVSNTPIYDSLATGGTIGQSDLTASGVGSAGYGSSGMGGQYTGTTSGVTGGSHVPASHEASRDILRDGESRLDKDTGVNNPTSTTGSSGF